MSVKHVMLISQIFFFLDKRQNKIVIVFIKGSLSDVHISLVRNHFMLYKKGRQEAKLKCMGQTKQ